MPKPKMTHVGNTAAKRSKVVPDNSSAERILRFIVGSTSKEYRIPEKAVFHHSTILKGIFGACCGTNNKIERSYRLDTDVKPAVFRMFKDWMCLQNIVIHQHTDTRALPSHGNKKSPGDEDLHLVELWVLAGRFLVPELQNFVVECIISICHLSKCYAPVNGAIKYVYKNTGYRSPLRRLMASLMACELFHNGWAERDQSGLSQECINDTILVLGKMLTGETNGQHCLIPSEYFVSENTGDNSDSEEKGEDDDSDDEEEESEEEISDQGEKPSGEESDTNVQPPAKRRRLSSNVDCLESAMNS